MLRSNLGRAICAAVVTVAMFTGIASADVFNMPSGLTSLQFVTVGNPGNAPDTRYASPGFGSVSYTYQMGKFEVTTGQYCEFLNAVAKTDTYGLYNTYMDASVYYDGCNIKQRGSPGNYSYTVGNGNPIDVNEWSNRPVNWISWGDAARFCNWLTNGQKIGTGKPAQDAWLTEDGSYYLNGATDDTSLLDVTRKANARYVIPTEDEWYKASYHKNDGVGGNYWDYPTGTNSVPSNILANPDPGNNANYYDSFGAGNGGWTIGSPHYRTEVGEFENSESPYGTFDQGGNVWEWNEAIVYGLYRGQRGGSFDGYGGSDLTLRAACFIYERPTYEIVSYGFRIAEVPEPGCAGLVLIGCLLSAGRGGRRK